MNNQVIRDGCGGTIYSVKFFINTISISIYQSEFINNTISGEIGEGGAIYVSGYSNNVVSIYRSVIRRNSVPIGQGGAVYVDGKNSSLSIHRSVIESNSVHLGSERCYIVRR